MQPRYWTFGQASYRNPAASYVEDHIREMRGKRISLGRDQVSRRLVEIVRSGFDAGEGKRLDALGFHRDHVVLIL